MARHIQAKRQSQKGQALLEGAVSLVLVIGTSVLCLLFLVNIGLVIYYKLQLSAVTNQAATDAASDIINASWGGFYNPVSPNQLTTNARQRINTALQALNLPAANNIQVTQPSNRTVRVTVNTDGPPWLIDYANFFPRSILSQEIACASTSDPRPPGTLTLSVTGHPDQAVSIPVYGYFRTPFSSGATNFSTNPPPDGVAAFRPTHSARSGFGQFNISVSQGNPTRQNPAPQSNATVFAGGYTAQ
ncbi:MAG: hypothetical protein K2W82_13690 [Candidatus Obscuribacterales bacterium]|nr:hypothetical protein [Candidatus Obscuribacterales bacterium]